MNEFHPFLDKSLKFKWSKLTPDQALIDIPLAIQNCQEKINELTNLLNLSEEHITYKSTFNAFDSMFDELSQAWSLFTHLNSVKDSPEQRSAFKKLNPRYIDFSTSIYHNSQLYELFKKSYSKIQVDPDKKITDIELRYAEKVIHEFQRSGADLNDEDKEEISKINKELADVTDSYKKNLLDSRVEFEFYVKKDDKHLLEGLPPAAIAMLKEKKKEKKLKSSQKQNETKNESNKPNSIQNETKEESNRVNSIQNENNDKNDDQKESIEDTNEINDKYYRFSLDPPLTSLVMKYAQNESIRKRMWEGLCSIGRGNHDNTELVYKILELRDRKAKLLGYSSFADFITENRMIKTGDNALKFIDELHDRCYQKYLEENKELRQFKFQVLHRKNSEKYTSKTETENNVNSENKATENSGTETENNVNSKNKATENSGTETENKANSDTNADENLNNKTDNSSTNNNDDNSNYNKDSINDNDAVGEAEVFPWERAYYSELLRQEKYDFNDILLRPYFSVSNVMNGVFRVTSTLYGIDVKERQTYYYPESSDVPEFNSMNDEKNNETPSIDESVEVWTKDVKYYEVYDKESKELLGSFYADWHPHNNKRSGSWHKQLVLMSTESPRNISSINGSLAKEVDGTPALLVRRSAQTIFHEFGHLCHFLLSKSPIKALGGTHVMRDFVEFPSRFLENWTWDKESLDLFARHYETNELIPDDLFHKMVKARNFHSATQLMAQLRISKVDLELHHHLFRYFDYNKIQKNHEDVKKLSIEEIDDLILSDYRDKNSSSIRGPSLIYNTKHLFASSVGYAADYYSYKWAEVLEVDAFTRFKEEGIMNEKLGHEIRDTIISQGNMKPPDELFRNFMGRDPDSSAFFALYGI